MLLSPFLAWRFLKFRRSQKMISLIGWMSILGVAIGVMALIVVLSVMGGFDRDLRKRILGVYSPITVQSRKPTTNTLKLMNDLENLPGVKAVSPFVMGQVALKAKGKALGVMVRGIFPEHENKTTVLAKYMQEGQLEQLNSSEELPGIIIGIELAKKFNLKLGDKADLISSISVPTPFGMSSNSQTFQIVGIFDSGMYEYDLELVYTLIDQAQLLFGLDNQIHGYAVKVDAMKEIYRIKENLQKMLSPDLYRVRTWIDMNKNLFQALVTEKWVMFWILLLIVLVAVFNIASTLIMIVMEKTKDIGILRAMGMDGSMILKIFIYQGCLIGSVGTLLGYISGIVLTFNLNSIANIVAKWTGFELFPKDIYYLDKIPTDFSWTESSIVAGCTLILCLLSSLYPAYQASRLSVVDSIRYE